MKERRVGQADLWDAGRALCLFSLRNSLWWNREEEKKSGRWGQRGNGWVTERTASSAPIRLCFPLREGSAAGGCQPSDRAFSPSHRETMAPAARLTADCWGAKTEAEARWDSAWIMRRGSCGRSGGGERRFWICLEGTVNRFPTSLGVASEKARCEGWLQGFLPEKSHKKKYY